MKIAFLIAIVLGMGEASILLPYNLLPELEGKDAAQLAQLLRVHHENLALLTAHGVAKGVAPDCALVQEAQVGFLKAAASVLGDTLTEAAVDAAYPTIPGFTGLTAANNPFKASRFGGKSLADVAKGIQENEAGVLKAMKNRCSADTKVSGSSGTSIAAAVDTALSGKTVAITKATLPAEVTPFEYTCPPEFDHLDQRVARFVQIYNLNIARLVDAKAPKMCHDQMDQVIKFLNAVAGTIVDMKLVDKATDLLPHFRKLPLAINSSAPTTTGVKRLTDDEARAFIANATSNRTGVLKVVGEYTCSAQVLADNALWTAATGAPKVARKSKSKSRKPDAAATDDAAAKKKADEDAAAAKKKAEEEAEAAKKKAEADAAAKKSSTKKSGSGSGSKGSKGEEGSASVATTMVALSCAIVASIILG